MQRRHGPADISAAAQEYLLALRMMASDGRVATTTQVGRHVGVTTQAASEMCRRLAADGLVETTGGRGLVLTTAGRTAADAHFPRPGRPGTRWNSPASASPGSTRMRAAGRSPSVARPRGPSRVSESSDSDRARTVTWAPGVSARASR